MSCHKGREIDPEAYLIDPRDPSWDEFRAHFPTCPDCSRAVAGWSEFERLLEDAARVDRQSAHPAVDLLVAFHSGRETVGAEERERIRVHLDACRKCRGELAALDRFDFSALSPGREPAPVGVWPEERDPPVTRRWWDLRGLLSPLDALLGVPGSATRTAALAVALLLLIAVPLGFALWLIMGERPGVPAPLPDMAPAPPLVAEATPPPAPQPSSPPSVPEESAEAPKQIALETPARPPATAPESESAPAPVSPPDPTKVAVVEEAESALHVEPPAVEPVEQEGSESHGTELDARPIVVAMASMPSPRYAEPPGSMGPARMHLRTRGIAQDFPDLLALAPDHVGLTAKPSPSLYWYASKPTEMIARLTLLDEQSTEPVLEKDLGPLSYAGIHGVALGDYGVELEPGIDYQWFVSISPEERRQSYELVAGGRIKRVEPRKGLGEKLRETGPFGLGHEYAAAGLWYDALEFFSDWIARAPQEALLRAHRAALLEYVGLHDPAQYDRRSAGTPSPR